MYDSIRNIHFQVTFSQFQKWNLEFNCKFYIKND